MVGAENRSARRVSAQPGLGSGQPPTVTAAMKRSRLLTWQTEHRGGRWGRPAVERRGLWLFRFPGYLLRQGRGLERAVALYSERLPRRGAAKMADGGQPSRGQAWEESPFAASNLKKDKKPECKKRYLAIPGLNSPHKSRPLFPSLPSAGLATIRHLGRSPPRQPL